jgi:hypothetical protein
VTTVSSISLPSILLGTCASRSWGEKIDGAAYVPKGTTAEDLVRHVAFQLLANDLLEWRAPTDFPKQAKAFGIDVKKIVDAAAPDTPEASVAPPKGTKAKDATKGKRRAA